MEIVGHRGACGHAPENTLKSFAKGIELGCQRVEMDIHASKDGAAVVIHDAKLDRTTNGTGAVRDKTLAELKQLDAGQGERIPTLQEVMTLCRGKVNLQIELKAPGSSSLVAGLLKNMDWDRRKAVITSFDLALLDEFAALMPNSEIGLLNRDAAVDMVTLAQSRHHSWLCPRFDIVSRELIQHARGAGLKVYVYHVNDPESARRAIEWGAEAIGTDYPEMVAGLLARESR